VISVESTEFILLSGCKVVEVPELVPARRGVYLLFVAGGRKILERTGYFRTEAREPLSIDDLVHVYSGAAGQLRRRILQHLVGDVRRSNLRMTFLSLERAQKAVSRSGTPKCHIKDETSLNGWLYRNAYVAVGCIDNHFEAERTLLSRYASPFNIHPDRASAYSQALMTWREAAFPAGSAGRKLPRNAQRGLSRTRRSMALN
jgi:hypothetical protein